jgi:hypothetical protein
MDRKADNDNKRQLEPHIIIHLRISKEDIQNSLNQKIGGPWNEMPCNNITAIESFNPNLINNENFSSWNNYTDDKPKEISKHNLNVSSVCLEEHPNVPEPNPKEDFESSDVKFKLIDAMCEFADANRRKEWPRSTSIWCRWCCAPFNHPPVAIPKWKVKKTFFVYGCYCDYSCASAHLFFRGDLTDAEKWESYNLLHLLRKEILQINTTEKIQLAGEQELLQKFGGHLSVEKFRKIYCGTHIRHKIHKIIYPPMVSIVPKIEEQSFEKGNEDMRLLQTPSGTRAYGKMKYVAPQNENYRSRHRWGKNQPFIPIDEERINKAKENQMLKRNKPLLNKRHTLFNYMNLKIEKRSK